MLIHNDSFLKAIVTALAIVSFTITPALATIGKRTDESWSYRYENGISLLKKQHYKESEHYLLESLDSVDQDVTRALASLGALEELYERTYDYRAKEVILLAHLRIVQACYYPCHLTADVHLQLGELYSTTQKYQKAKHNYYQALKILTAIDVDDLPVGSALNNLAYCEFQLKDFTTAEMHYKQALAVYTQALGTSSVFFGLTAGNLADLYECTGRNKLALLYFEKAIYSLKASIGDQHPVVKELLQRKYVLRQKLNNPLYEKRHNHPNPRRQFQLPKQLQDVAGIPPHWTTVRLPV